MNINPVSTGSEADDDHLMRCWRIQSCKDCLTLEPDCSWCPFVRATFIRDVLTTYLGAQKTHLQPHPHPRPRPRPRPHPDLSALFHHVLGQSSLYLIYINLSQSWTCVPNSHRIPFLAPAQDENICPHWAERWEVRTRPLGCQVSTITTLTSIVSIASTLVFVLLVTLAVWGVRKLRAYGKKNPGWWRVWRYDWRRFVRDWQRWLRVKAGMRNDVLARESLREGEPEPLLPS
ncbi:hypothetical protein M434DRAFT_288719 [Hypoxylon sp. CO27-5]|nr:hypothetical protein M434DRAFT_288719 [Hypoxylon sp. CO27-5]